MKVKKVSCTVIRYREFPELLFGTSDDGIDYFDATHYLLTMGDPKKHNIPTFRAGFTHWINAACEAYSLTAEDVVITDAATGHTLIDSSLALLFAAYLDPGFGVWMMERISEMLMGGIVLSDTLLLLMARNRFSEAEFIESENEKQSISASKKGIGVQ